MDIVVTRSVLCGVIADLHGVWVMALLCCKVVILISTITKMSQVCFFIHMRIIIGIFICIKGK